MKESYIDKGKRKLLERIVSAKCRLSGAGKPDKSVIETCLRDVRIEANTPDYAKLWYEGSVLHLYKGKNFAHRKLQHFKSEGFAADSGTLDRKVSYVWIMYEEAEVL